jgi:hypothetical protein
MAVERPFSCLHCGCKKFLLVTRSCLHVDFGKEGAIEVHPFLEGSFDVGFDFICDNCKRGVSRVAADEMRREVI